MPGHLVAESRLGRVGPGAGCLRRRPGTPSLAWSCGRLLAGSRLLSGCPAASRSRKSRAASGTRVRPLADRFRAAARAPPAPHQPASTAAHQFGLAGVSDDVHRRGRLPCSGWICAGPVAVGLAPAKQVFLRWRCAAAFSAPVRRFLTW
jgi:hypothetical protein